jgi:ribosomal protein S18 acetylase RimI-like enzyme
VTAGFVAVDLRLESGVAEINMPAVDPDYQRRSIGTAVTSFALDRIKGAGMTVARLRPGPRLSAASPASCLLC